MENIQVPRLPLLRDNEIAEEHRPYIRPGSGEEVYRTYANYPPVLIWQREMYDAFATFNPAGPVLKEMVRLRVAGLNDCRL